MSGAHTAVYAGVGTALVRFDLDVATRRLTERDPIALPGAVEFACRHPRLPILYAACSVQSGDTSRQWVCAVALDSGALLGASVPLPSRSLHLTVDAPGRHLLLAHHRPAGLSVLHLGSDGAVGDVLAQRDDLDVGTFPHQVRVSPDGTRCWCVSRGVPPAARGVAGRSGQAKPGAVTVFAYADGRLGEQRAITLGDGSAFGPRNLDFGPRRQVYLALETQSEVLVLDTDADGWPALPPLQRASTLADPAADAHQGVGPILVHPDGRTMYVTNRAYEPGLLAPHDRIVDDTAENSIVVYSIDQETGLIAQLQRIDSGGACPRTLGLDESGTTLVVANSETWSVRGSGGVRTLAANLTTFEVAGDGTLERRHTHPPAHALGSDIVWADIVATQADSDPTNDEVAP